MQPQRIHDKTPQVTVNAPYSGLAKIYDRVMGDVVFPLIVRNLELAIKEYGITFNSAADIGCGTGRFARYLTRYGIPVWGVDISPAMLSVAAKRLLGTEAVLIRQDITKLKLPAPVDIITCNFDTLNYLLSHEAVRETFSSCRDNLNDNGHLIFDCIAGSEEKSGSWSERQEVRLPGISSTWLVSCDPAEKTSVVKMRHSFRGKGNEKRIIHEVHRQRWYPIDTLKEFLLDSGLELRGVHDAETFSPAAGKTFWTRYVARKVAQSP